MKKRAKATLTNWKKTRVNYHPKEARQMRPLMIVRKVILLKIEPKLYWSMVSHVGVDAACMKDQMLRRLTSETVIDEVNIAAIHPSHISSEQNQLPLLQ